MAKILDPSATLLLLGSRGSVAKRCCAMSAVRRAKNRRGRSAGRAHRRRGSRASRHVRLLDPRVRTVVKPASSIARALPTAAMPARRILEAAIARSQAAVRWTAVDQPGDERCAERSCGCAGPSALGPRFD